MKHLETRQKRKAQRRRANLEAIAFIAFVLMIGILLGSAVTAQKEETDKPEPVEARVVQYDPPPEPMPEIIVPEVRYALTDAERDLVERVVMAEAEGEGFDGQRLVAQCILNTAEATDMRPDEVVTAPNQYAAPAEHASEMVMDAVSAVFDNGDMVTDEPIRWFYAPRYVYSAWHESKRYVLTYQNHKFFAEW